MFSNLWFQCFYSPEEDTPMDSSSSQPIIVMNEKQKQVRILEEVVQAKVVMVSVQTCYQRQKLFGMRESENYFAI